MSIHLPAMRGGRSGSRSEPGRVGRIKLISGKRQIDSVHDVVHRFVDLLNRHA
jgi:hypothetical protein